MDKSAKLRTLFVFQILDKYTDENHILTTVELMNMLAERGIECDRKSVYSDIHALEKIGCDIMNVRTPKRGYFMANRLFEVPEVLLLMDAVSSAGFITTKKTNNLIKKLKTLVSVGQAESLVSRVYVESSAVKCDNEEIYIIIDLLHDAIMRKRKVTFRYRRRNVDVENKKKHTEKTFIVSPYALIWKQDHYYLVCNNEKYDNLMNLRIDRIKRLEILEDEKARPVCEVSSYEDELDVQDYSSSMFNMFSGEKCEAVLRCDLNLREEILDRFGSSIPLAAYDENHFETTVNATLSDGFVSWLMQYGSDIKVIEPKELADMVKQKAQAILNVYKQ